MDHLLIERCKNMLRGALVADAAALGFHWIYDQDHIRALAPAAPEFRKPAVEDYNGVFGFFAHGTKSAGDFSQYGEQLMVMLRSLATNGGAYDRAEFADQFRAHFGYGGAYVGYIDHATRDTLDNRRRFEDAAFERAQQIAFTGEAETTKSLITKAMPLLLRLSGQELKDKFLNSLDSEDPEIRDYAGRLICAVAELRPPTGAHDFQLPAIAKLPGLVAVLAAHGTANGPEFQRAVSSAVRVTNDHPTAAEYGTVCGHIMAAALSHGTVREAISAGRKWAGPASGDLLDQAEGMAAKDNAAVTRQFGMACDLPFGVPSAVHNIATAGSFTDAVRRNIFAGGDSCGRALLVGAVMGAVYGTDREKGIPQDWIAQLYQKDEVEGLLSTLFDAP